MDATAVLRPRRPASVLRVRAVRYSNSAICSMVIGCASSNVLVETRSSRTAVRVGSCARLSARSGTGSAIGSAEYFVVRAGGCGNRPLAHLVGPNCSHVTLRSPSVLRRWNHRSGALQLRASKPRSSSPTATSMPLQRKSSTNCDVTALGRSVLSVPSSRVSRRASWMRTSHHDNGCSRTNPSESRCSTANFDSTLGDVDDDGGRGGGNPHGTRAYKSFWPSRTATVSQPPAASWLTRAPTSFVPGGSDSSETVAGPKFSVLSARS